MGIPTPEWYTDKRPYSEVAAELRNEVDSSSCQNILISSEEFHRLPERSENPQQELIEEMRRLFRGFEVCILLYVRTPLEFAKSLYNHANTADIPRERFIDFFYRLSEARIVPDRQSRFWRSAFSNHSLKILAYRGDRADHIGNFLAEAGMTPPLETPAVYHKINARRDIRSLELDRLARIFAVKDLNERRKLLAPQILQDESTISNLKQKIGRLNDKFRSLCETEGLYFRNASMSLEDLIIQDRQLHEDQIEITSLSKVALRIRLLLNRTRGRLVSLLSAHRA